MPELKSKPEFKAGVGLSRKWDAREAGREVALTTLEKLGDKKPDFFLLFSTIHYEKYGGFQEFLAGVWDILPEGTPLIGGTIAGFIIPQGCFTRGATALAVSYPNMDVAVGIGRNTKRAPHLAAKHCAEMIKGGLEGSRYPNKFIYEVISGSLVIDMPGIRNRRVLTNKIFDKFAYPFSYGVLSVIQKGSGREEEVLSIIKDQLPDYYLIGVSTIDDNNMLRNYQFCGSNVYTNSVIALGMRTDQNIDINTSYGLKETEIDLEITKLGRDKRTIIEINNKPALEGYLTAIGMDRSFVDERLHRRTFFLPLGYSSGDMLFPNVVGLCLGEKLVVGYSIENRNLRLLLASGKDLINAIDENLQKIRDKNKKVALIVSCAARLETLGAHIYTVKDHLSNFFGDVPFLLVYSGGEDTYVPNRGHQHVNESFNVAIISS